MMACLVGCPEPPDDDAVVNDDDVTDDDAADNDDSASDDDSTDDDDDSDDDDDDDDSTSDDDDSTDNDDDDDSTSDDDDDDSTSDDDDDVTDDDDDSATDDDDSATDDDDSAAEPCLDDPYEDNESLATATPALPGPLPGLVSCPADVDIYAIDLLTGDTLQVDAAFSHAEGNVDVEIHDQSHYTVVSSASLTDDESASWTATGDATHHVYVRLTADSGSQPGNPYALDVSVALAPCLDDGLEDDDVVTDHHAVGPGAWPGFVSCPADDDWFGLQLVDGDLLEADVLHSAADRDIDLWLYDPDGVRHLAATTSTDDEWLSVVVDQTGLWSLRVALAADAGLVTGNGYDLELAVTCGVDAFEPNDAASPASVTHGLHPDLRLCPVDEDWYAVDLLPADGLDVDLAFDHSEGDVDLQLLDPSLSVVADSTSSDDDEAVSWTAMLAGPHYLRAWLVADTGSWLGNVYDLDLDLDAAAQCPVDAFEDNDVDVDAAPLLPGSHPGLASCPGDADWYTVELLPGQWTQVDLVFDHEEGDVDASLFDPSGALVDESTSATDGEQLSWWSSAGGAHAVLVELVADAGYALGNTYDAEVLVTDCVDDDGEEDDVEADATPILTGLLPERVSCPGDADWYLADLAPDDPLVIDLLFEHSEGDLDVTVWDPSGLLVAEGVSVDDDEQVALLATTAGPHLVLVELVGDSGLLPGNGYELEAWVGDRGPCLDDGWEPNDYFDWSAPQVPVGQALDLVSCPGDGDWFLLPISAGDEFVIDALFEHAEGDIDLHLYSGITSIWASSTSTDDDEQIVVSSPVTRWSLIRVMTAVDSGLWDGNPYQLVVSQVAGCLDDALEDNDLAASATELLPGSYPGLVSCDWDYDFFVVPLSVGETLQADAWFSAAEGNLNLQLRDPFGWVVAQASSTGDDESLSWTATSSGRHRLLVWMAWDQGAPGTSYDLDLSYPGSCADDSNEDNDTLSSATSVYSSYTAFTIYDQVACPSDEDWYSVYVPAGDSVVATASFEHADGDLDLFLWDPSLTIIDSSASLEDSEQVASAMNLEEPGRHYYLQVWLASESDVLPGNDFTLTVQRLPGVCADDDSEDNDDLASAAPITPGQVPGRVACPSDADWFAVSAQAGDDLAVELLFAHGHGDLALGLYDPSGAELAWVDSLTDDESTSVPVVADGLHHVAVELVDDPDPFPGNTYDLDVTVASPCSDDPFEDDDEPATATVLAPGAWPDLAACPDDLDHFGVYLQPGDAITVELDFEHTEGDVDLALYDPLLQLAASSTSLSDDESITFVADMTGLWIAEVSLVDDPGLVTGNAYDLSIDVACVDDAWEDNAFPGFRLQPALHTPLRACPDDDDWYQVMLAAGDEVTADLLFAHADGDLDLHLLDGSLSPLASSTTSTDDESLSWTAALDGLHLLRVQNLGGGGDFVGQTYELDLHVEPVGTCYLDWFEANEMVTEASAFVSSGGSWYALSICDSQLEVSDFYEVLLLGYPTLDVSIWFDHAEGDLDLSLETLYGGQLATSLTATDNEQLAYTAGSAAQTVYVHVLGYGVDTFYDMDLAITP